MPTTVFPPQSGLVGKDGQFIGEMVEDIDLPTLACDSASAAASRSHYQKSRPVGWALSTISNSDEMM